MNSWLNWIGIARRAGSLAPGNNQVEKALKAGDVALIVISTDAGPSVYRKYHLWAQDLGVPILRAGTKDELGGSIGMGPHAVLAILDTNIAQRLLASGELSGGIQRGRKGQSSGLRVGEGVKTRQSTTHRSITSAQSRKHQESHEHGGTGSGTDGAQHHGGKTAAGAKSRTRAQTFRTESPRGPKTSNRGTAGRPSGTKTVSKPRTNSPSTGDATNTSTISHDQNAGRPTRKSSVPQRPARLSREPQSNRDPERRPPRSLDVSEPARHSRKPAGLPKPPASSRPKPSRSPAVSQSTDRRSASVSRKPRPQRGSSTVSGKPRAQRNGSTRVSKPTSKQ